MPLTGRYVPSDTFQKLTCDTVATSIVSEEEAEFSEQEIMAEAEIFSGAGGRKCFWNC